MREELTGIWEAITAATLPPEFVKLFANGFLDERSAFDVQETYILDFKDRVPKKFSSEYGASIVRLVLAFYNTYGGIIVFGIDDKTRECSGLDVDLDIESLNSMIKEVSGVKFEVVSRKYDVPGDPSRQVTVALVPRRGSLKPARLIKSFGKYSIGTTWLRERHEVLVVAPENVPLLYSSRDTYPSEHVGAQPSIQRSMPPKPATIKQFVGRESILLQLWDWLIFDNQPRIYLHGPGGSGKSAIAYEFADSIASTDSEVRFEGGEKLDYVIYLSAKESELDTSSGKERRFREKRFSDLGELFSAILLDSGFLGSDEISSLDDESLENSINELFSTFSGLIVIDDIDTLSRKGQDTGEEQLFMQALQGKKDTKIIYTLRQSPVHARKSSIHVPGLADREVTAFVEVASIQFDVAGPTAQVLPKIKIETNSLPLLVENIIGLRKYCGSYEEAIRQHAERGGDDARRYLYQREFDQLDKKGKSREVLATLALLKDGVRFTTLADMLDLSRQVVIDSLNEVASIFLIMEDDATGETLYQLSPVARPFIENVSQSNRYFDQIKRKVELFRSEDATPEEAAIIIRFERLVNTKKFEDVVSIYEALDPADVSRANPKIRALLGRAYANLGSSRRVEAIECFKFALSMRYFDIEMMRSWYFVENRYGHSIEEIREICRTVVVRPTIAQRFRAEFYGKLGAAEFTEARALKSVSPEKAYEYFSNGFRAFCKNLYLAQVNNLVSTKTPVGLSNLCREFIITCRGDLNPFFRAIESLADEKHDVSVDAAQIIVQSLVESRNLPFSPEGISRFAGLLRRTRNKLDRAVKAVSKGPGAMLIVDAFVRFEESLDSRRDP